MTPAAVRSCSTLAVATVVAGSVRATTGLTTGGFVTTGSRSPCRKSVLNPKILGTSVPLNLVFSPVPIRRSRAIFYTSDYGNRLMNYSREFG